MIELIFLGLLGCRDSKTIRIQFDSAEKVRAGDIVVLQNAKIGGVKSVKINKDESAVVVIVLDRPTELPQGTDFILSYDIFGTPFISIEPASDQRLIDPKEIQKGTVKDSQGDIKNNRHE